MLALTITTTARAHSGPCHQRWGRSATVEGTRAPAASSGSTRASSRNMCASATSRRRDFGSFSRQRRSKREITGGVGPDVTVEAAGYPETLDAVFRLIRQFGTVVIFWVQGGDIVPVDTRTWMDNQPTIIPTTGARSGDPITHIKNMVALKERGQADPGRMVTHLLNFDVEDVNKAYQMYEQRLDNVLKVVMSVGA